MAAPEQFVSFAVPDIGEADIDAIADAMRSGWLTTGPRVQLTRAEDNLRVAVAVRDLNYSGYEAQFQALADNVS